MNSLQVGLGVGHQVKNQASENQKKAVRVRPMTAVQRKAQQKTTSIQTGTEDFGIYDSNAFLVQKQKILERPQSSYQNANRPQLKINGNLTKVFEEDSQHHIGQHTPNSSKPKVVIFSSRNNSVINSSSPAKLNTTDALCSSKRFSIKVDINNQGAALSTRRLYQASQEDQISINERKDTRRSGEEGTDDTYDQMDIEQMYKQRQLGKLPIEETPLHSHYSSSQQFRNKNSIIQKQLQKQQLTINQQDILQQNLEGFDSLTLKGLMKKVITAPSQQMKIIKADIPLNQKQKCLQNKQQRPQSQYQRTINPSFSVSAINNERNEFHQYVYQASQNVTPHQQDYYNNLLLQQKCNKQNFMKPANMTTENSALKTLLRDDNALNQESGLPSQQRFQQNKTSGRLKLKRNIDHNEETASKNIEINKLMNLTPQEKISMMIQQNEKKQHNNQKTKKQIMFIKKQINHGKMIKKANKQDDVYLKIVQLEQIIQDEHHLNDIDEFKHQIMEQVHSLMDTYVQQKQQKHWNKFSKFYRLNQVTQNNQVTDYWKQCLEIQKVGYINKCYEIDNHKQLYQDIGEVMLKSYGILKSDNVNEKTKEKFRDLMCNYITKQKENQTPNKQSMPSFIDNQEITNIEIKQ